jgi:hypothetical protein
MFNDSYVLDFLATLREHCRSRAIVLVLLGLVFIGLMGFWGVKCSHKMPAKTAVLQPGETKVLALAGSGRLQDSGLSGGSDSRAESGTNRKGREAPGAMKPSLKLLRIARFGRILELVGTVEAGSRLTVNDDPAEVSGDGSFKYFTMPFPRSIDKVTLVLKAANLAGKTAVFITPYDFSGHNEDH